MKALRRVLILGFIGVFLHGCGGCGEAAGAGEICDPEIEEACESHEHGLVCMEDGDDHRCLHPVGGRCDVDGDLCPDGAECSARGEESPRCLWTQSSSCDPDEDLCANGLVCDAVGDDDYQCHQPVVVQGVVFDAETLEAIEGAHIIAFNEEGSALSDVAISDGDGNYTLQIPAIRDEDGEPVRQFFTLRASAQDYQTFPGGIRTAQPIDASRANESEDDTAWVIDTAQTDVALIPLPGDEQGYASISGVVDIEGGLGGVLVVAESDSETGFSGVSARDGSFTVFNVPPATYDVRGYIADYQIEPEVVEMESADVDDVILGRSSAGITDLHGQIQIVAAGDLSDTSVVLMVASTFDPVSVRGEVPAGLRAPRTGDPNIRDSWTIEGVPAGEYYVLAGFEMDLLVRDPNEGTAGTDLVRTVVAAEEGEITVTPSFKVTRALRTVNPGTDGPEGLTDSPTLSWSHYAQAQSYDVIVFDAFGEIVWERQGIAPPGGGADVQAEYDGPFEEGMYYQFRAIAYDNNGNTLSTTEVLRGVFYRE